MVVERDLPVHVWGMAAPGEQVTVTFRDETRTTRRRPRPLEPLSLTRKSRRPLSVDRKGLRHSSDAITLDDILVGDVWVASGQSNMEFGLRQAATAADDLPNAANPQIRLLLVTRRA
jgi:sialate O-acetylesterase